MAKSIKGITIELGGDTTGLDKALKEVKNTAINLQKELKTINASLKFNPNDTTLLTQKIDLLEKSIANTSTKLQALKAAQEAVTAAFEKNDGSVTEEQYRAFQRELVNTEAELKSLEKQLKTVKNESKSFADTVGDKGIGTALKELNLESEKLASELKKVDDALKLDPDSTILITQKMELLSKSIEETENKLTILKGAQQEINRLFSEGKISEEQYREFQREIVNTENQLKSFEKQLSETKNENRSFADSIGKNGMGNALQELSTEVKKLETELEKVNEALNLDPTNIDLLKQKWDILSLSFEETKNNLQTLKNAQQEVNQLFADGKINDEEYRQYQIELAATEIQLKQLEQQLKETAAQANPLSIALKEAGEKMKEIGDRMKDIGHSMVNNVSKPIAETVKTIAGVGIEFESAFAGVRKTIDATEEEFSELRQGVRDLAKDLPATTTEISAVGEAAGQLGIVKENVLEFTKTMIDLGESTNLTSEAAATFSAIFANITGMSQTEFDNLGSSIVALGNNFATTEAEIAEMSLRLAGAGAQIGLSEAEILGFSTALSSVGIAAEMGGSAFSKAMINMQVATELGTGKAREAIESTGYSLRDLELMASNDSKSFKALADSFGYTSEKLKKFVKNSNMLEDFANVSGMTADQFAEKFRTDATGAITDFIVGLSRMDEQGMSSIATLDEMGFTEVRLRDTLLRLTNAEEVMTNAISLSSQAWEENTALTDEAAQRYATTESQLQILKNKFSDIGITISEALLPILNELITNVLTPLALKIGELAEGFTNLDSTTQNVILVMVGIIAAIGPVLVILGTLLSSFGTVASVVGTFAGKISALIAPIASATGGTSALSGVIAALTGPIGIAIAAVTSLAAGFVYLYKTNEEFREKVIKIWELVKEKASEIFNAALEIITNVFGEITEAASVWGGQLKEIIDNALSFVYEIAKGIFEKLKNFWDTWGNEIIALFNVTMDVVTGVLSAAWEFIKGVIKNALDVINGIVKVALALIKGDWTTAWEEVKNIFNNLLENIKTTASNIFNNVKETFNKIVSHLKSIDLMQVGQNIIDGLIKGIRSKIAGVLDVVSEIGNSITGKVKEILNINSPSKVMEEIGENTGEGLIIGIDSKTPDVKVAAEKMALAGLEGAESQFENEIAGVSEVTDQKINSYAEAYKAKSNYINLEDLLNAQSFANQKSSLDEQKRIQKENLEDQKYERDIAEKEALVASAKNDKARLTAENNLADAIEKREKQLADRMIATEKDVLKERESLIKEAMSKINDLGKALTDALKNQYTKQRDDQLDALDKQLDDLKSNIDKRIKEYEREYKEKLKLLDTDEDSETSEIRTQIDALDKLTAEEERSLKEQDYNKRLAEKQNRLAIEEDAEKRAALQEEINEMIAKRDRELLLESRNQQKEDLKAKIQEIKKNYEEQKELLKNDYENKKETAKQELDDKTDALKTEMETIKEHYATLLKEENLQAEARKLMLDENNEEMINILKKYNPNWLTAGKSFAENLLDGILEIKPEIENVVSEIMSLISDANEEISKITTEAILPDINPSEYATYQIKAGDTLSAIAREYGTTVSDIASANNISNPDLIHAGREISIPINVKMHLDGKEIGQVSSEYLYNEQTKKGRLNDSWI